MRITRTMARVFLVGFLVIALPSLSVHSTTTAPTTAPSQSPESTDAPAQTTKAAAADPTTGLPTTGSPAPGVPTSSSAPDATTAMEDDTTTGASDPSGVTGSTMGGGDTATPVATTKAANASAAATEGTTTGPDSSGGDTTTSAAGSTAEPSTSAPEQTSVDTSDTSTAAPAMDTSTAAGSVDTATPATGSGTATEAGSTAADSSSTPAPSGTTTMGGGEATTTGGSSETEPTVGSPTAPAPTETSTDASTTAPSTMPPTTTTPAPSVRPGGYFVLTLPFGSSSSDVLSCSPCDTTQIKEAVKNAFQGIPGFLFIEEQEMQRRKRETKVTLRIVFDPTQLMGQLNQTQRETKFADSINSLGNQTGISVNTTLSTSLAATFGEQTSSLCKISRACPAQYRCDDATQTCVHLCAGETCNGNGQCQVEIRGDSEPKAVCMCNSDYETTYTGEKCQESETSKRKVIAILAGVLGTFCAILLLVVIVLCCRLRGGFGDSSSKYELGGRRGFTNNAYSDDVNMKKMG